MRRCVKRGDAVRQHNPDPFRLASPVTARAGRVKDGRGSEAAARSGFARPLLDAVEYEFAIGTAGRIRTERASGAWTDYSDAYRSVSIKCIAILMSVATNALSLRRCSIRIPTTQLLVGSMGPA